MPDYTKTIIYKLINYDYPELVYVGSTTNFTKRKQHHKSSCNNEKNLNHNLKVYTNIRENDGWENWNMIKICDYPCNNKREAELEEDKYMTQLKASMNSHRASRTKQQYYEDNREKLQENMKEYYDANKEKIQENRKEYYDANKEKIKEYRDNNKEKIQERMKEYQETNKEKLKEYKKEYYETNKEKNKIKCECGCEVVKSYLKFHQTSKKHIDFMK
jgi:DNA anti-recombination protein RmuC